MASLRAAASPNPVDFVKWVRISHAPALIEKHPARGCHFYERRRWDSNPRGLSPYLISSQGRYDHFDTPPRPFHYNGNGAKSQARPRKLTYIEGQSALLLPVRQERQRDDLFRHLLRKCHLPLKGKANGSVAKSLPLKGKVDRRRRAGRGRHAAAFAVPLLRSASMAAMISGL